MAKGRMFGHGAAMYVRTVSLGDVSFPPFWIQLPAKTCGFQCFPVLSSCEDAGNFSSKVPGYSVLYGSNLEAEPCENCDCYPPAMKHSDGTSPHFFKATNTIH